MFFVITLIALIALAIAAWAHFTKAGQADVTALEARIKTLETYFRMGQAAAKPVTPPASTPVPAPPAKPAA